METLAETEAEDYWVSVFISKTVPYYNCAGTGDYTYTADTCGTMEANGTFYLAHDVATSRYHC